MAEILKWIGLSFWAFGGIGMMKPPIELSNSITNLVRGKKKDLANIHLIKSNRRGPFFGYTQASTQTCVK